MPLFITTEDIFMSKMNVKNVTLNDKIFIFYLEIFLTQIKVFHQTTRKFKSVQLYETQKYGVIKVAKKQKKIQLKYRMVLCTIKNSLPIKDV